MTKTIRYLLSIMLLFGNLQLKAQQSATVTDSMPVLANGLKIGYSIASEEEKEVGKKGTFRRYSVQFYVTNTNNEAKIILYKDGFSLLGNDVSPVLAQFTCSNATGAKFTAKGATIESMPCTVLAAVEDKDCATSKTVKSKRFVQIGYWIKPGQTISEKRILYVPQNERPKMTVVVMPNATSTIGSAIIPVVSNEQNNNMQSFVKIKNFAANTFLNTEKGVMACTTINDGWWSAQWQLGPVSGTNYYYVIMNRWKNSYISSDANAGFLSENASAANSMWTLDPVANSGMFTIKNVGNNTYLNVLNGNLQTTPIFGEQASVKWIIQ